MCRDKATGIHYGIPSRGQQQKTLKKSLPWNLLKKLWNTFLTVIIYLKKKGCEGCKVKTFILSTKIEWFFKPLILSNNKIKHRSRSMF